MYVMGCNCILYWWKMLVTNVFSYCLFIFSRDIFHTVNLNFIDVKKLPSSLSPRLPTHDDGDSITVLEHTPFGWITIYYTQWAKTWKKIPFWQDNPLLTVQRLAMKKKCSKVFDKKFRRTYLYKLCQIFLVKTQIMFLYTRQQQVCDFLYIVNN